MTGTGTFERIYDAFIFNGELELLNARCLLYGDRVDYFEIFESPQTISRAPKTTVLFEALKNAKFDFSLEYPAIAAHMDKLWPHRIDIPDSVWNPWDRERFMREYAYKYLKYATGTNKGDSLVFFGDVDEFPLPDFYVRSREQWAAYVKHGFCYAIPMLMSYGGAHNIKNNNWYGTRVADNHHSLMNMRDEGTPLTRLEYAGWHFSYAGGPQRVREKLKSFPHTELSADATIDQAIKLMEENKDPFGRTDHTWTYVEEYVTNSDSTRFPVLPEVLKGSFLSSNLKSGDVC